MKVLVWCEEKHEKGSTFGKRNIFWPESDLTRIWVTPCSGSVSFKYSNLVQLQTQIYIWFGNPGKRKRGAWKRARSHGEGEGFFLRTWQDGFLKIWDWNFLSVLGLCSLSFRPFSIPSYVPRCSLLHQVLKELGRSHWKGYYFHCSVFLCIALFSVALYYGQL